MTEEEVVTDPNYVRAMWMLEHQVTDIADLVRFWKIYGKARTDFPDIELHPNWDVL